MTVPVVIVGAGGSGREALSIIDAMVEGGSRLEVIGFVDDGAVEPEVLDRLEQPLLGGSAELAHLSPGVRYVVGVAAPMVRRLLVERAESAGLAPVNVIHPDASWGRDVTCAPGALVWPGVQVAAGARLGRHCHLNNNVTVGAGARIGHFVSVNPLAAISCDAQLGDGVLVGTSAAVLPGLTVAPGCIVGAGAVVESSISEHSTVVGRPARLLRGA